MHGKKSMHEKKIHALKKNSCMKKKINKLKTKLENNLELRTIFCELRTVFRELRSELSG